MKIEITIIVSVFLALCIGLVVAGTPIGPAVMISLTAVFFLWLFFPFDFSGTLSEKEKMTLRSRSEQTAENLVTVTYDQPNGENAGFVIHVPLSGGGDPEFTARYLRTVLDNFTPDEEYPYESLPGGNRIDVEVFDDAIQYRFIVQLPSKYVEAMANELRMSFVREGMTRTKVAAVSS